MPRTALSQIILLITVLGSSSGQNCGSLPIDAIFNCQMVFNNDATCSFNQCLTHSPGNPQNYTDWAVCYQNCCPGFVVPGTLNRQAALPCYYQFISTPTLVHIIGGLLGLLLILICVIIPCCQHQGCLLFELRRKCCLKEGKDAAEEEKGLQEGQEKKEEERKEEDMMESRILKRGRDVGKVQKKEVGSSMQLLENQQKNDSDFNKTFKCQKCFKEESNCITLCKHSFHLSCLTQNPQQCFSCKSRKHTPFKNFCKKCFTRYILIGSVNSSVTFFTCQNCKK